MQAYENCVYTILKSSKIDEMILEGENTFVEKKVWRGAFNFLEDAKTRKEDLYLIFAPAQNTTSLYAFAKINKIEIIDKETKVTFSELRLFVNQNILKTTLVKTDETNVDVNYIRTYLLCKTNSILPFIDEDEDEDEDEDDAPEEILQENDELLQLEFHEGKKTVSTSTRYERNKEAREACIKYYKPVCYVCGFDFEKTYGELGKGFIHVHHLKEISSIAKDYKVDPIKDLRPLCPNCHAMIHCRKTPLTIDELKMLVAKNSNI